VINHGQTVDVSIGMGNRPMRSRCIWSSLIEDEVKEAIRAEVCLLTFDHWHFRHAFVQLPSIHAGPDVAFRD